MRLHFLEAQRERLLFRHVHNGMRYAHMTRKQSALCALLKPVRYWGYLHHRLRLWWALPEDRFVDLMRNAHYRVVEVRHEYVVVERWTRYGERRGLPPERVRVQRPLPFEWWPR